MAPPHTSETAPDAAVVDGAGAPVVVIGGGPAGLTAAYRLVQAGDPVVVVEQDSVLGGISRTVERDGKPVNLSAHEFAVLEALLQRPGAVLSRAQLEERLYGWQGEIGSNAVEVYVHGLRRKLGNDAIRTLRGVGYFVPKS